MYFGVFLLIVVMLALLAVLPYWGHSRKWGFVPSGSLFVLFLSIVIIMGLI